MDGAERGIRHVAGKNKKYYRLRFEAKDGAGRAIALMSGQPGRRRLGIALSALASLGLAAALISRVNTLPSLENRSVSTAFVDTADTRLGRAIKSRIDAHPGRCGIYSLTDPRQAFAARMHLANVAERSLDIQYYIWRNDMSGTMLFDALRRAAERGVRVRLLLDDNNTSGLDAALAALDS